MNRNVYATILVILSIGLYFTVTRIILAEAGIVQASNKEYIAAIESAQSLITLRDQIRDSYNKLSEENRARLDKIVPKSIDNIRLIIDLKNVGMQHSLILKGIQATAASIDKNTNKNPRSVGTPNTGDSSINAVPVDTTSSIPSPTLEKVTVSFSVTASYQQFISLLQDLEASLRILDITSLSVSATENGQYDWKVELQTYWLHSQ